MDATTLGVLVGAWKAAQDEGNRLELISPDDGNVRKLFRITGLEKLFILHGTVAAALDQHGVGPVT